MLKGTTPERLILAIHCANSFALNHPQAAITPHELLRIKPLVRLEEVCRQVCEANRLSMVYETLRPYFNFYIGHYFKLAPSHLGF
jgi:hypothetical protein